MEVNHAHVYRSSEPEKPDFWGNRDCKYIHEQFPWLEPLIVELEAETVWSKPHHRNANSWTALIFVDYARDRPPMIKLEIKPSRTSLEVTALPLAESTVPTLQDLQSWIIANIRSRRS